MSAEKRTYTRVPTNDWNRTRNQVTNLNRLNSNLQNSLQNASRQREQDRRRHQQRMQQQEASFTASVNGLRSGMKSMEQRQAKAMQRQGQQFQERIRKQGLEFNKRVLKERDDRISAMKKQKRQLESRMDTLVGEERRERERQVRRLENHIQQVEHDLRNEISRVEQEFDEKIDLVRVETQQSINNLRDWTVESMQQQRQEYLTIAAEQQREIGEIRQDVARIFAKEQMNQAAAADFIADLEKQIAHADEDLQHQRFAPGELYKIKNRANVAKGNLATREQSAISGAQEAYFELVDLREQVIRKQQEFDIWHNTTLEAARGLFENIRMNRQVELEEDTEKVEVDFWTKGAYQRLEMEMEAIKNKLEHEKDSLTLTEVQQLMEQIKEKDAEKDALIKEAIERVISSQIRAELGDAVVDALENEGFTLLESGYEQEDQRKIYLVKVANRAGTEIVAAIIPDDETNTNAVSINTKDDRNYSEAATVERFEEIKRVLQEAGLDLGETQCSSSHIEGLYDVDNILKKGGSGVPKRVLEQARMINGQTK